MGEYVLLGQDRVKAPDYFRRTAKSLLVAAFSSGLLALFFFSIISTDWSSGIASDTAATASPNRNIVSLSSESTTSATIPHNAKEDVSIEQVSTAMNKDVFTIAQDTQPPLPTELASAAIGEKYLSYLPHSGFHNQRIALVNALALGHLLNRTVIVPYVRLGPDPVPWKLRGELETRLELGEKARVVEECRALYEAGKQMEGNCRGYHSFTDISYSYLFNMSSLSTLVSMRERTTQAKNYFTSPVGLNLSSSDIHTFPYSNRYDYQVLDRPVPAGFKTKYARPIDIASLQTPEIESKKLLAFGSMFGTWRIMPKDVKSLAVIKQIQESFTLENEVINVLADKIIEKLGGREAYLSVHCRLGSGNFEENASTNMQDVFRRLLTHKALDFDVDTINQFVHGRLSLSRIQGHAYQNFRESVRPSQCQQSLYTDPKYASLNTPIYMATDSHHPAKDPNLQLFFQTFPCIFVLSDFQDGTIPEMAQYRKLVSKQDGLPLHTFLTPLLDAQIASKSAIGFVGSANDCDFSNSVLIRPSIVDRTYWSTFSAYITTLQAVYTIQLDS